MNDCANTEQMFEPCDTWWWTHILHPVIDALRDTHFISSLFGLSCSQRYISVTVLWHKRQVQLNLVADDANCWSTTGNIGNTFACRGQDVPGFTESHLSARQILLTVMTSLPQINYELNVVTTVSSREAFAPLLTLKNYTTLRKKSKR